MPEPYYEQLECEYERLCAFRDSVTKAVQSCHELIDEVDIYERYPNVVVAFERIEALL
jgi:hypothetical protein